VIERWNVLCDVELIVCERDCGDYAGWYLDRKSALELGRKLKLKLHMYDSVAYFNSLRL
jgi:hypothetical protein